MTGRPSSWDAVFELRTPGVDVPPLWLTLYRDNLGGLLLFLNQEDGNALGIPLSADDATNLADALNDEASGEPL